MAFNRENTVTVSKDNKNTQTMQFCHNGNSVN